MPTYEYRCDCGKEFELFQSITAEPVADCPKCGAQARRLISGGMGLIFKGNGFYITDYKNKGASGGDGASKSAADSKSGSASDSKPAEAKSEKAAAPAESKSDAKPAAKADSKAA